MPEEIYFDLFDEFYNVRMWMINEKRAAGLFHQTHFWHIMDRKLMGSWIIQKKNRIKKRTLMATSTSWCVAYLNVWRHHKPFEVIGSLA